MEVQPPFTSSELDSSSERLAKAWLVAIIERTPLDRLADGDDVVGASRRLAEVFGSLHAALTEDHAAAVNQAAAPRPEVAQAQREGDLEDSLDALVAEYRRYGHPFALALIELEGLRQIYEAHGRESGDLMSMAATTMIRNQIRMVDRAFRVDDDAFCVLAPNVDASRLRLMGDRLARVVEGSQAGDGPRISILAGVSACPEHGNDRGRLLEAAREALETARGTAEPVGSGAFNGSRRERES